MNVLSHFLNTILPPKKYSLSVPRSSCQQCGTPIRIRDNIPVISWLLLKGKCHNCSTPISARYPLVEILTAACSGYVAFHFWIQLFHYCADILYFHSDYCDVYRSRHYASADQLTLPLTWAGIALALLEVSPVSLQDAVIGAIAGYLCLWSVYWGFKLLTGKGRHGLWRL